jgi:hypothetical protein
MIPMLLLPASRIVETKAMADPTSIFCDRPGGEGPTGTCKRRCRCQSLINQAAAPPRRSLRPIVRNCIGACWQRQQPSAARRRNHVAVLRRLTLRTPHLCLCTAFRNMKYLRTNFPSRAGNGAPQSRQVISRKPVSGAASAMTIW